MRILISNDDGIYSRNLHLLYAALRRAGHDVRAVAPAEQHSGAGCCLTVHDPILTKKVCLTLDGGEPFEGVAVSGRQLPQALLGGGVDIGAADGLLRLCPGV